MWTTARNIGLYEFFIGLGVTGPAALLAGQNAISPITALKTIYLDNLRWAFFLYGTEVVNRYMKGEVELLVRRRKVEARQLPGGNTKRTGDFRIALGFCGMAEQGQCLGLVRDEKRIGRIALEPLIHFG